MVALHSNGLLPEEAEEEAVEPSGQRVPDWAVLDWPNERSETFRHRPIG